MSGESIRRDALAFLCTAPCLVKSPLGGTSGRHAPCLQLADRGRRQCAANGASGATNPSLSWLATIQGGRSRVVRLGSQVASRTTRESMAPSAAVRVAEGSEPARAKLSSPEPIRAKSFKSGARLLLQPCAPGTSPSVRKYVVCPSCSKAYVGNAVKSRTSVRCASCSATFETSPDLLYVEVEDTRAKRRSASGHKKVVDKASKYAEPKDVGPDAIACPHFENCAGCTLSVGLSAPAVALEAQAFAKYDLELPHPLRVHMGPPTQWRTHAKLAVRPDGIGLFRPKSHDVVRIPSCVVHHPAINAAARALQAAMAKTGYRAYDERIGKGLVRYAVFTVERSSGKVQVTIVWNARDWKDANPQAPRLGHQLWEGNRDLLHSVWFNWNTSSGNTILSQRDDAYYLMHGLPQMVEDVLGAKVYFNPTVFRQANLDAFQDLILPKLLGYIPKDATVVEMYGGVGVISLAALKSPSVTLSSVTVTEINAFSAAPFRKALAHFPHAVRDTARYVVGSDDDTLGHAFKEGVDTLIVDPPRSGLSDACRDALAHLPRRTSLRRLIYLSCGFDAFRRDAAALAAGSWRVSAMHGYVLFPGSNHLETLAVFDKRD